MAMVRYYRAQLHLAAGRLRAALLDAKAFVSLSPRDPDGITLLETIRAKMGSS